MLTFTLATEFQHFALASFDKEQKAIEALREGASIAFTVSRSVFRYSPHCQGEN